jgi:hypothetical protein
MKPDSTRLDRAEEERRRLTLDALTDVDAGRVIGHKAVEGWADSLDTDEPLSIPEAKT